jgi:hypothetical protein
VEDLALQAKDFVCGPHATLTHFGLSPSTAMGVSSLALVSATFTGG